MCGTFSVAQTSDNDYASNSVALQIPSEDKIVQQQQELSREKQSMKEEKEEGSIVFNTVCTI